MATVGASMVRQAPRFGGLTNHMAHTAEVPAIEIAFSTKSH
ncbi:MAG TPA: hypothetical protein VGF19_10750 [Candidatus Acidoferrum sp.]